MCLTVMAKSKGVSHAPFTPSIGNSSRKKRMKTKLDLLLVLVWAGGLVLYGRSLGSTGGGAGATELDILRIKLL